MCDKLTTTTIPHSPALLKGKEVEKIRSKIKPRKKGRVKVRCFTIWFYFPLPYSDLIGNKLNYFPQAESILPMTITGEPPLSALISAQKPIGIFSLPFPAEE